MNKTERSIEDILKFLKEKGYKLTHQRRVVLDVMLKNEGNHLTIEELYSKVKNKYPEIGLATVYRTIQLLEEVEIVSRLNLDNDGVARYELAGDKDNHQHHHLICLNCKKVIEVEEDLLDSLESEVEKNYDFQIQDHNLKFYGVCKECRDK